MKRHSRNEQDALRHGTNAVVMQFPYSLALGAREDAGSASRGEVSP